MKAEDYAGVIELWKAEMVIRKAKRLGFKAADLNDAVQQTIIEALSFEYDTEKAKGLSEEEAFGGFARRKLIQYRRCLKRKTRAENLDSVPDRPDETLPDLDLALDLQDLVSRLGEREQAVCGLLFQGYNTQEIAKRLGCSWSTVERDVKWLREYFQMKGMDNV